MAGAGGGGVSGGRGSWVRAGTGVRAGAVARTGAARLRGGRLALGRGRGVPMVAASARADRLCRGAGSRGGMCGSRAEELKPTAPQGGLADWPTVRSKDIIANKISTIATFFI